MGRGKSKRPGERYYSGVHLRLTETERRALEAQAGPGKVSSIIREALAAYLSNAANKAKS